MTREKSAYGAPLNVPRPVPRWTAGCALFFRQRALSQTVIRDGSKGQ